MSKTVMYAGMDVGKEELWVAISGHRARMFRHTGQGVRGLVRWLQGRTNGQAVQVCMEATGIYSRRVALRLLREPDIQVSIINPAQIKAFRQVQLRRTKTDGVDAHVILAFAESQRPPAWQPGTKAQEALAALVKQADRLRRLYTQSLNRREHDDHDPRVVRRSEQVLQRCLLGQLALIDQAIEELCETDKTLAGQVALLCTIPGMGNTSATQLLAYGGIALQERSARALTAHAGLAPCHRQSGISVRGRSHLAKQGNRRLRTVLYMPTLVATRCNPVIKESYQLLIRAGKPKKLALIACMRKLLLMTRAILKTNTPFNPQFGLT